MRQDLTGGQALAGIVIALAVNAAWIAGLVFLVVKTVQCAS